ncbi:MAG: hypothetical protein WC304_00130 [Candidatus Gracilibacteria bacterium]|jgi:hypothetical protein
MNTKFIRNAITRYLLEILVFGSGFIFIIGIAYAFSTWNPKQPPQANPANGNVEIGCDSLTGITYASSFTTWSAEQAPLANPVNGNVKVTCSPYLAGGESKYTEADCVAAGGNVKAAGLVNLCSFKPGVGGHTCAASDLNCNTNYNPESTVQNYHFATHPRYWSCPSSWSRYKGWGQYSTNGCWVTQEGWYNWDSVADTCYYGGFSDGVIGHWSVCTMWLNGSGCDANGYAEKNLIFPWAANNNRDGFYNRSPLHCGAMCPSGCGDFTGFSIMEEIGCY